MDNKEDKLKEDKLKEDKSKDNPNEEKKEKSKNALTELKMFVALVGAQISNMKIDFKEAVNVLELEFPVVAINSNWGHKSLKGYEQYLKTQSKSRRRKKNPQPPKKNTARRGDLSCFDSAVEPVVMTKNKVFFLKCFTSNGKIQVSGVKEEDFSDAREVLQLFVDYLNKKWNPKKEEPMKIIDLYPNLINFKTAINFENSKDYLASLSNIGEYLSVYQKHSYHTGDKSNEEKLLAELKQKEFVETKYPPPLQINTVIPPGEHTRLELILSYHLHKKRNKGIKIFIYHSGKINILGSNTFGVIRELHKFFEEMFRLNWDKMIVKPPEKDKVKED